jgi:inorganic pyrophosphatase
MDEIQSVPLNDVRAMKRSTSRGSSSEFNIEADGMEDTSEFRIQAVDPMSSKQISLWHDISLIHLDPVTKSETPYLNFVCEIPKFTRYLYKLASPCHNLQQLLLPN